MASGDRKQALLIMMRELLAKTDEEHSLNATELGKILESEGCPVDRRTIYANIEALENFFRSLGMPTRLGELGIPTDRLEEMAKKTKRNNGGEKLGFLVPQDDEGILKIYQTMV